MVEIKRVKSTHHIVSHTGYNPWYNLWYIIFKPSKSLESLRTNWNWFPAYVGSVVVLSVIALITVGRVVPMIPDTTPLPLNGDQLKWTLRVTSLIMPFVAPIGQAFLLSLVLKMLSYFVNMKCRYSKLFSIAMWAAFPAHLLTTAFNGFFMMITPVERWHQISASFAAFTPPSSILWKLARFVEISNVCLFILVWAGLVIVHKKTIGSTAAMMTCYIVLWATFSITLVY